MPSTPSTSLAIIDSRSTLTTGIAAHTRGLEAQLHAVALGRREELLAVAGQQLLVRGDHGLAGLEQLQQVARVGSTPPMTSATTRTSGSSRMAAKSSVSTPGAAPRSRARSRTSARRTSTGCPATRAMSSRPLAQQAVDGGADGAVAEQRDGDRGGHGRRERSGSVPFAAGWESTRSARPRPG